MAGFWASIIMYFCIAFGVVFGGSMLSGIAAVLTLAISNRKNADHFGKY